MVVAVLGAVATTSGCSGESPTTQFTLRQGTTRAVALYDQQGDADERVRLRTPNRHYYLRMDCIGEGDIEVAIEGQASGGAPCGPESSGPSGFVGLAGPRSAATTDFEVMIDAPEGAHWSVAVDVSQDGTQQILSADQR
jgi:hypothetical protein